MILHGACLTSTGDPRIAVIIEPANLDKTGVHSRRELVGSVFFAHYEPRFRDNERRTIADKPIRGEPWRSR